jgi:hypothetical protein
LKYLGYILILWFCLSLTLKSEAQTEPDFQWGNASYFNVDIGETVVFQDTEVKLLKLNNHFNQLKIGKDTIWVKVSRRALPKTCNSLRVFVADNKNVKALASNPEIHSILQKDALICLTNFYEPLLNPNKYLFPISFNDGFLWNAEEDSHMFSFQKGEDHVWWSHGGIDIDLHDARGIEKHWIVAIENSKVVGVKEDQSKRETSVVLESEAQPGIYYVYSLLNKRKIEVKNGNRLVRGEPIGNIWGDELWGHLHFAVIKSDSVPNLNSETCCAVNFFPQLYELYFKQTYSFNKTFTKGVIQFGQRKDLHGNEKNLAAFEGYLGKGWKFGRWNTTDRVEWTSKGEGGNARLWKILFSQEKVPFKNPNNWYVYQINVQNGTYRIRAKMGDYNLPSWQKVWFEDINAATYNLQAGEFKWTPEKVVKVKNGKLTVRIFVDETNKKPAGISEIVFQKAY